MKENIDKILKKVCSVFDITIEDVRSKNREKHLVYARMICSKLIHSSCDCFTTEIAKHINRDSSTVRYYISVFEQEYLYNKDFRAFADEVGVVSLEITNDFQRELEQELNEIIG